MKNIILDRQKFINDLSNNPRSVLSPMDAEIQRNCDSLIRTLPLSSDMMDSKGNLSSYFNRNIEISFVRKYECNESHSFLSSFNAFK